MLTIANTTLGELFPLGLGSLKAENGWTKEETFRIFDAFLDRGGNVYDTARIYSAVSKSEEYIGEWLTLTGNRNRIVLVSKGGHPDITGPNPDLHITRLTKSDMVEDLEISLKTLQTDHIDLYLYHRDDVTKPIEYMIDTMEDFVREGKIRYYGCSNWTTERMNTAQEYCAQKGYRGFAMNQALLNAASDNMGPLQDDTMLKMDPEMRAFHKEHPEFLATAYSGIAVGFFSQYLSGGEAAVKDHSYLTPANIELAYQIEKNAKERGITLIQEALRYFKTLDMPCLPLFLPRDIPSLMDAMEIME